MCTTAGGRPTRDAAVTGHVGSARWSRELGLEVGDAAVLEAEVGAGGLEAFVEGSVVGGELADALLEGGVLGGNPLDGLLVSAVTQFPNEGAFRVT